MSKVKGFSAIALMLMSFAAHAFLPAGGLWVINSENTGQSGRGFQIEVENEVLVFTYFGYKDDGSSAFYLAAGALSGNAFSADLTEYGQGTALGGGYKPAVSVRNAGKVNMSFTSGKHGTITLPGEATQAISKVQFGYPDGPDGLLGSWLMTMMYSIGPSSTYHILTTKLGTSSGYGNGIVTTTSADFACEVGTAAGVEGLVTCIDYPLEAYADTYYFKFSGDRGTGTGYFLTSTLSMSSIYAAHLTRVATRTGRRTGLNEGTMASLDKKGASGANDSDVLLKQHEEALSAPAHGEEHVKSEGIIRDWADQIRAALQPVR